MPAKKARRGQPVSPVGEGLIIASRIASVEDGMRHAVNVLRRPRESTPASTSNVAGGALGGAKLRSTLSGRTILSPVFSGRLTDLTLEDRAEALFVGVAGMRCDLLERHICLRQQLLDFGHLCRGNLFVR